jgi:beta-1,4-mannosyltransferase
VAALRVLHFPDWRGANPYQQLLADALAQRGVEVSFTTYAGALLPLWRNLRRHRADVLHIHWIADIIGADEANLLKYALKQIVFRIDVALVRLRLRNRIVWTVHNLTAHENRHPGGDLAARRFLARRAGFLLAHCAMAKEAVADAYGVAVERIRATRLGNFIAAYPNQVGRAESRRRLGIPEDRFVFLHLGSIRPYKGVENLLDSFQRLRHPRKHLLIAGASSDAAYLSALQKRAATHEAQFEARFIPATDLQFFFNAADVVVFTFKDVLTSASLVLAMGFGRMVVAPRLGCIPEHADPAGCVLYDAHRPDGLDAALEEALTRDADACGRHNLARVRTFDWATMAEQTVEIYEALFSGSSRP